MKDSEWVGCEKTTEGYDKKGVDCEKMGVCYKKYFRRL